MGLRELLIPQDKIFFEMFERQAATVREAAYQLVALSEDFTNVRENGMRSSRSNTRATRSRTGFTSSSTAPLSPPSTRRRSRGSHPLSTEVTG